MQNSNSIYNLPPPGLAHPSQQHVNYQTLQQPPAAPDDPELKNIIDKLANFVSRNGLEFENVTKEKQRDNPKFSFLFGGANHHYYQYRLNIEKELSTFFDS